MIEWDAEKPAPRRRRVIGRAWRKSFRARSPRTPKPRAQDGRMLRPVPTEHDARARYTFHRPPALPELKVLRVRSDGPLSRSFPDSYSSVLHLSGRSDWS